MVGRIETFLRVLSWTVPHVMETLSPLASPEGLNLLPSRLAELYGKLQQGDFSHQVLSAATERLAVLRMDDAGWSDLGTPQRLFAALKGIGEALPIEACAEAHV